MLSARLTSTGRLAVFHPTAAKGNNPTQLRQELKKAGTLYNATLRAETVSLRGLPSVVESLADCDVSLRPSGALVGALRAEVALLREEIAFLEGVEGDCELYPYQQEGVAFLWRNPVALLFDEMGLGKTVQALMAITPGTPVIVVCPASLKTSWRDEVKRWRRDLTPEVIKGRKAFRFPEPGDVVIVSYESLPEDFNKHGKPWPKTIAVFDEAHAMKNGRAQRTRRGRSLIRGVRRRHGAAWLLTGTPLLNKPQELWSLLVALQIHKETFGNFTTFARLFGGRKDVFGYAWDGIVAPEAIDAIRPYTLRRERIEVLPDLPTKTYRSIEVPAPTGEVRKELDKLDLDDLLFALEEGTVEDLSHVSTARKHLAAHKLREAMPLIREYEEQEEPLVFFSVHREPVEALGAREGWTCIHGGVKPEERGERVAAFQRGEHKGIAITIAAGGTGLTLTRAHHAVFLDLMWTPAYNVQAEDRVCRIGQDRGVIITYIVSDHDVDRAVMETLAAKSAMVRETTGRLVDKPPSVQRDTLLQSIQDLLGMMGG